MSGLKLIFEIIIGVILVLFANFLINHGVSQKAIVIVSIFSLVAVLFIGYNLLSK